MVRDSRWRVLGGAVLFGGTLAFPLATGCETFSNCEERRSCEEDDGGGGAGGEAATTLGGPCVEEGARACDDGDSRTALACEGGVWVERDDCGAPGLCDASAGACVECVESADCDDGLACNGAESCEAGRCEAGRDPCADEAEAGCVVRCEEADDGPSCSKAPEDADDDGHLSPENTCSATSELPKDDCDDTRANVYPGATEVCDGFDNDCDGANDLGEGFGVGGEVRTLFSQPPGESLGARHATWSKELGRWLVVLGTSQRVLLFKLFPNGAPDGSAIVMIDDDANHASWHVRVATRGEEIGLLWGTPGAGTSPPTNYTFARFSLDGNVATRTDVVPLPAGSNIQFPELMALEDGGWLLTASVASRAIARRFSSAGAAIAPVLDLGATGWRNGAAVSAGRAIFAWKVEFRDEEGVFQGGGFRWASWSGANMAERDAPVLAWPSDPVVTDGYTQVLPAKDAAVLLLRPRGLDTHVMKVPLKEGVDGCGPVGLTGTSTPFGVDGEVYATGNETSGFYLGRGENTGPYLQPVPYDCDVNGTFASQPAVELGFAGVSGVDYAVASSPDGHLAAFLNFSSVPALTTRAFGNLFCDELPAE